jgi:hypothetical protein
LQIEQSFTQSDKSLHTIGEASVTSRLSMTLRLERHHFPGGGLRLACHASLPNIVTVQDYRTEKAATLAASNQRLAQEPPRLSSSSSASWCSVTGGLLLLLIGIPKLY